MDRENFELFQILGGSSWVSVLALFALAGFYLLAPVWGYVTHQRNWMLIAMWVLVIKLVLVFFRSAWFQFGAMYFKGLGGIGSSSRAVDDSFSIMIALLFSLGEPGLSALSMVFFMFWISSLRRIQPPPAH